DQLFGISLYYQGILFLYSDNDEIIQMNKTAYQNVMERGNRAIQEAKEILEEVKKNPQQIDLIRRFKFPPIHGIGLDEMTQRATLLINACDKLFPDRPRNTPLSHEEHTRLMQEAINKF
ncbi:hypothetical protein KJ656_00400, partial [bacterium]|nr:hypothetical protein [bacterium]